MHFLLWTSYLNLFKTKDKDKERNNKKKICAKTEKCVDYRTLKCVSICSNIIGYSDSPRKETTKAKVHS